MKVPDDEKTVTVPDDDTAVNVPDDDIAVNVPDDDITATRRCYFSEWDLVRYSGIEVDRETVRRALAVIDFY